MLNAKGIAVIKIKFHSVETGLGRVYFQGSNSYLYCLQSNASAYNMTLMTCAKNGEPENNVAYPALFECEEALKELSIFSEEAGYPRKEMLEGALTYLTRLELDKIKISVNRSNYTLIDNYRGKIIGEDSGVIAVLDLKDGTVFFPSIDDSKMSGVRKTVETANTVHAAREYIDSVAFKEFIILDILSEEGNEQLEDVKQVKLSVKQLGDIINKAANVVQNSDDSEEVNSLNQCLNDAGVNIIPSKSQSMTY